MTSRPKRLEVSGIELQLAETAEAGRSQSGEVRLARPKLCGLAHNRLWMFCSASAQNASAIRSSRQAPSPAWPAPAATTLAA
jgi:hypothetical protein